MVVEKIGMKEYYRHSSFFFSFSWNMIYANVKDDHRSIWPKKNISDKVTPNQYTSKSIILYYIILLIHS